MNRNRTKEKKNTQNLRYGWFGKIVYLFFLIFLWACGDKQPALSLGESEEYFDQQLSSLSPETDSTCWLGSETGEIWRLSPHQTLHFDLGTDRIYKVITQTTKDGDTLCWIGVRNSGLQKWLISQGKITHIATYTIPHKGDKYSPYDLIKTSKGLLVGTSNGLFLLPWQNKTHALTLLYTLQQSETANDPLLIHNLTAFNKHLFFASSQEGLLKINLQKQHVEVLYKNKEVRYVSAINNKVYALMRGKLYALTPTGDVKKQVSLHFPAKAYTQVNGIHYFFDEQSATLSKDLLSFTTIPLRHNIPFMCTNVFCIQPQTGFMYLITNNALWRVPQHIGVFEGCNNIVTACSSEEGNYFLNAQNELFFQAIGKNNAVKIFQFPSTEHIVSLHAHQNTLYYTTTTNSVKRIVLHKILFQNQLLHTTQTLFRSRTKITASYLEQQNNNVKLYLGVQDSLFMVCNKGQCEPLKGVQNQYATSFLSKENSAYLYITTLNKGIYYGKDNVFTPLEGTENLRGIRHIAVTNAHSPEVLIANNHQLKLLYHNATLKLNGIKNLLYVNDSLFYAVLNRGILQIKLQDTTLVKQAYLYPDIPFNGNACFVAQQHLYLGSELGMLVLNAQKPTQHTKISFISPVITLPKVIYALLFVSVLLLMWLVIRFSWLHYLQRIRAHSLSSFKQRMNDLEVMAMLVNTEEQTKVKELSKKIDKLATQKANITQRFFAYSDELILLNRSITLALNKQLQQQIKQIKETKAAEKKQLALQAQHVLLEASVEEISKCVFNNKQWLNLYNTTVNKLHYLKQATKGVLENALQNVLSPKALPLIEQYINNMQQRIEHIYQQDEVIFELKETLKNETEHNFSPNNLHLLKQLKQINHCIIQLEYRNALASAMQKYSATRKHLLTQNEQRIQKKFDSKLENEIAEHTTTERAEIEKFCNRLFMQLQETDEEVLENILEIRKGEGQTAKVLMLLIANAKVKRTHLPGMIGLYGNLNPVISRLVKNKIKPHEPQLSLYVKHHPLSLVRYIRDLSL